MISDGTVCAMGRWGAAADLCAAMDAMRQTAEKERKITDEREALKGMMAE
jgi:hypothetical protein